MDCCWPYEKIIKEFSIGDHVKLIKSISMNAEVGATAIVVGYEESVDTYVGKYYLEVKWDRNGLDHMQCDGGYYADEFINTSRSFKEETNNCPRCKSELKDHMSFGLGEMIKKCEKLWVVLMETNLTRGKLEKLFPIGSIAEVINNEGYEHICSLGEKIKVISYGKHGGTNYLIDIEILKDNKETSMFPWRLKSCNTIEIISSSSCPQCNGELVDKYSEWAGKDIKKCKECGWC